MAIRRFGPVLGAGVQVTEKQGDITVQQAPTGVTVLVGVFEKGIVNEPQFLSGKSSFEIRNGATRPDSDAPKAALDFYKMGRGAGELITFRVTGGDEQKSTLDVYTRQGTAAAPASGRKILGRLTAKNGGRWGGRRDIHVDEHTGGGDLTATTLDTGDTMVENEWAGGILQLKKVTSKSYRIVGNTAAGVISVEGDQDLLADWTAGAGTPANRYVLTRSNTDHRGEDQSLAAEFVDGLENPTSEFGLRIYEDGVRVKSYDNLSANPAQVNYWANVINRDKSNYWIDAEDLYVGDKTVAAVRPSNFRGVSKALSASVLTLPDPDVVVDSPGSANPTVTISALGANVVSQVITGTVGNSGADITWTTTAGPLSVVEAGFHAGPAFNLGAELLTVDVTNGGTALADGDTISITVLVLEPGEAVGGKLYPDIVNEPGLAFTVESNTRTTVSVRTGLDLTNDGAIAAGEVFDLRYAQEFSGGTDSGVVTDADYLLAFDPVSSPLNKIFGKNKGLVKIATPGVTSTVVTKAGLEYAAARNYQYRVEIPSNLVDEDSAISHINSTIGRSDYGVTHFPSFGYVLDVDATPGAGDVPLKLQSLIGMILGREALVARNHDGYHKAEAGIDVNLPEVLELTTGDPETATVLNEELLNPQGINLVKFRQGSVILWGDRSISPTSEWKWKHQREQMSHYENILRENFDFLIFALNNKDTQERASTPIRAYFLAEFTKGALFTESGIFESNSPEDLPAFRLKIDSENNNAQTRADGDMNAEITLALVNTVERFRILIGKAGIFDAAA